ncbi:hypothetical protein ACSNOI_43910, partial [Actinomadura kijaniata]|uniref:hypothetical protein n=1 Tax=Actinomadura kijaniata TaxID=46161 RepID=UPI003F1DC20A
MAARLLLRGVLCVGDRRGADRRRFDGGDSGVRIRTAQAKDVEAARQLIALTGSAVSLEGELAAAVRDGTLGAVAMQGLT